MSAPKPVADAARTSLENEVDEVARRLEKLAPARVAPAVGDTPETDGHSAAKFRGAPHAPPRPHDTPTPHLTLIVTQLVKAANIGKTGSCHLFRHAMATLMLDGGADVRMVQAMLGHASLNTTALQTHVAIRMLKEVHERTHPGASLRTSAIKKRKGASANIEAAELLAALEAEQAEEGERTGAASAFDEEPGTR